MSTASTYEIAIGTVGEHPTVRFAAQELQAYLGRMLEGASVTVAPAAPPTQPQTEGLLVGTFAALAPLSGRGEPWPRVADPALDDAYAIHVIRGNGFVAGSNPRSVLLGVYRLLRELGCRFLRPGPVGECVPRLGLRDLRASLAEAASYRHRTICIEGAVSFQNVVDTIAWAPKVGYNGYFTQFRESYIFFERWYAHRNNPLRTPEPFTVERARAYLTALEAEVERRDLLYHAVGHGWTCEPFGFPGLGWDREEHVVPSEVQPFLAEVDGRRDLWHGVPLNTNLCYSNEEVRRRVVDDIVSYLRDHRHVYYLHFWLADGSNNQCECADCQAARPADWYVMMLNALDQCLTAEGLEARVVFLAYVDLLWPPERETIQNPDRFVLMFAPITRSYREPFRADAEADVAPYERNRLTFPSSPAQNLAHLRAWQKGFSGDSFIFDYHLWRAHFADPGHLDITRVLAEDVRNLSAMGLNGYVSCQVQRAHYPTGLPMYVLGHTLWNAGLATDTLVSEYAEAAYGLESGAVLAHLEALSQAFREAGFMDAAERAPQQQAAVLQRVRGTVTALRGLAARNLDQPDPCRMQSWWHLRFHADLCSRLIDLLVARAAGNVAAAQRAWQSIERALQESEELLQPVLDVWAAIESYRRRLA